MNRTSMFRAALALFLLTILLGGSAEVSVVATEILFVVVIVIIAGLVVFSIVRSKFVKKRRAH